MYIGVQNCPLTEQHEVVPPKSVRRRRTIGHDFKVKMEITGWFGPVHPIKICNALLLNCIEGIWTRRTVKNEKTKAGKFREWCWKLGIIVSRDGNVKHKLKQELWVNTVYWFTFHDLLRLLLKQPGSTCPEVSSSLTIINQ